MDTLVAFIVAVIVIGLFMRSYLKKQKKIEELALAAEEQRISPSSILRNTSSNPSMSIASVRQSSIVCFTSG